MRLFLCGDVMTGRGVDQILPHPSGQHLLEPYVKDARDYVRLAATKNGPVPFGVDSAYIWGDALAELDRAKPDARIVNLETSVTASDDYWPGKAIHYRMHPENVGCLTAARIDVCGLANNHVLDFGYAGLTETLETLARAGVKTAGAGRSVAEAQAPAIVPVGSDRRVLVWAVGGPDSGIFEDWTARAGRPGLHVLPDYSDAAAAALVAHLARARQSGDAVVVSVHWGANWGYDVPRDHVRFAHRLIDGGVDVVHGHSSHHPRPIEIYRRKLILYGCGDVLNDYEGIGGNEKYRGDLVLMYFVTIAPDSRALTALQLVPMQIRKMRLVRIGRDDTDWLRERLGRVSASFGTRVALAPEGRLNVSR